MTDARNFFNLYRHNFARVAVAIPRTHVADPESNAKETIALLHEADSRHAALTVFPELGLSSYACDDLFHQRALQSACLIALGEVVAASRDVESVCVVGLPLEIDALLAARVQINKVLEKQGAKVSVNDLVMKAVALALKRVPEANASFSPEGIAYHHHADISMAVAIDGGLITPIIRQAELKSLAQIATEAKDLAERARTRKLKPEEFMGGTFSVSNLGMFGIRSFGSIINPPQGCILSVGAGEKRPVVRGDQLAIATVMTVTLTCDHRVVDGAVGARWLEAFKGLIEDPITMIV